MLEWQNNNQNTNISSLYKKIDEIRKYTHTPPTSDKLSPLQIQNILKQEASNLNLHNLTFMPTPYIPHTWAEMNTFFQKYRRNKTNFLRFIGYSHQNTCQNIGLSSEDIKKLKNGTCPENYTVHIKKPFDFGGSSNFENLSLIPTHPLHIQLHSLIEFQIGCGFLQSYKTIYIPYFEGYFYND